MSTIFTIIIITITNKILLTITQIITTSQSYKKSRSSPFSNPHHPHITTTIIITSITSFDIITIMAITTTKTKNVDKHE